jgi:hypothetical protein
MTSSSHLNRLGRRLAAPALAATLALTGAECADDDSPGEAGAPTTAPAGGATTVPQLTAPAGNTITIQNFTFMGIDSARADAQFRVVNQDSVPHTVSAVDGSFKFEVAGGQTANFPRTLAAGSYPIRCDIHPTMTGTLVVR